MPTSKSNQTSPEDRHRSGMLMSKSSSFHGHTRPAAITVAEKDLRRPRTAPELLSVMFSADGMGPRLTKLLLNVTVLGSIGAVRVLMTPESTVGELVAAAVGVYIKEGRRPTLASNDPSRFDLHYSPFSLESLDREEKLMGLGSRNFFVCPKKADVDRDGERRETGTGTSCSKEAEAEAEAERAATKSGFSWLKFMVCLQQ